jgi:hypothetical protein
MIYFWSERNLIVEDGVARKVKDEDVSKMEAFVIPQADKKVTEQSWAIEQLKETDLDILRWFESGVEPIGLKKYRDDLRIYYKNLELGLEVQRPILDPRTTIKKIWDVVTLK